MTLMDKVVKSIKKDKREKMMIDMMPLMMEGIDMNELLPKMMANMLKDLSADDIIDFIKKLISDNNKLAEIGLKIAEANLMPKVMMKTWKSKLSFEETIESIKENAPKYGWYIPDTRDLQIVWHDHGLADAEKITVIYFCNGKGGYSITREDELKAMSVMMPMGVSVYETSKGEIEVAAMNIGMMSKMFSGVTNEVLSKRAIDLENTMSIII